MGNMSELSVTLTMTPEIADTLQKEQGALEVAKAYQIDGPEVAEIANEELRSVKRRIAAIKEWKTKFVAPAKQIIANAEALFDPALESLQAAEKHIKGLLSAYMLEVESQRLAAERERQEAERRARQKAEQEAAAARAAAEQKAADERRRAEELERQRQEAEAAGNAAAAREAAAKAAAAQERAQAAIENGEAKAMAAVVESSAAVVAPPAPEAPALAGFSTRDNWLAEMTATSEGAALQQIVAAAASGRTDLLALLKIDSSAMNRLAKALKANFNVPGFKAVNRPVAASRSK